MWKITKDGQVGYFTDEQLEKIYWILLYKDSGRPSYEITTNDKIGYIKRNGYQVYLVPDTILVKIKNWVQGRFARGLFTWMKK